MDFLHAIFDLDGTLLDSMPVWETLGERYLQAHGKKALPGMRADTALLSMRQTADYFIERYGIPGTQQSVMDEINAMAADDYLHRVPAKPYVPEYLAHLKANGVNLCLATATDRPLVEGALKRLDLLSFFDRIFTCTEFGVGKDRPDIFYAAMEFLGGVQENSMVFEDALHAIETAGAAGFRITAVYDETMEKKWPQICALTERQIHSYRELLS